LAPDPKLGDLPLSPLVLSLLLIFLRPAFVSPGIPSLALISVLILDFKTGDLEEIRLAAGALLGHRISNNKRSATLSVFRSGRI